MLVIKDILERHKRLVRNIARGLSACRETQNDLTQEGLVALVGLAKRYREVTGVPFAAYAATRIRGSMKDWLRSNGSMRPGVCALKKMVDKGIAELCAKGIEPSEEALARHFSISLEEIQKIRITIASAEVIHFSDMSSSSNEPSDATPEKEITDTSSEDPLSRVLRGELRDRIAKAIPHLPRNEQQVIRLYYYTGLKMHEIGNMLGVKESRISQLHLQACRRLREVMTDVIPNDYIPDTYNC